MTSFVYLFSFVGKGDLDMFLVGLVRFTPICDPEPQNQS